MSFITPSTAIEGSVVTSAIWNSDVRDNLSYLYSEGTARIAAGSALAGSITIAGDYLDDIITHFSVGTITSDYIIGTADLNKTYQVDPSGGTVTITVGTVNPTGSKVDFVQMGSGTVLFQNDGTANLNYTPSTQLRTQYSAATLLKTNTTDWLLFGDLA